MPNRILIIDDDVRFCNILGKSLSLEGYAIYMSFDIKSASEVLKKETINMVLLDVNLPDGNGAFFAKSIKEKYAAIQIFILSGLTDIKNCVLAIKNGATDYIIKGDPAVNLIQLIKEHLATGESNIKAKEYKKEIRPDNVFGFHNIIGKSKEIKDAIELANTVADSNVPVLILGETGTGKELFAKSIHNSSSRRSHSFVAINCSSFGKELLESELFGYKNGAFTGAVKDKKGLLEEADGGTLFLDEIGEMEKNIQAKLLRVLEAGEFIKLGDTAIHKVDIRLISATNKDLAVEVKKGSFREDLFYRINLFTIQLPPLRARKDDILLLAGYYAGLFAQKVGKQVSSRTKAFEDYLQNYPWKGNIRELKNVIERAVILMDGSVLSEEYLPYEILYAQLADNWYNGSVYALDIFERLHIQKVLLAVNWNKPQAAKLLNISISTLYRKIEDYMLLQNEPN